MLNKILDWLLVSSSDPNKWGLSFYGAIVVAIPHVLTVSSLLCTLHLVCTGVTEGDLTQLATVVSNIVTWALSIVGGSMFVVGFVRKLWLTITGQNKVVASWSGQ